ncbi:MAG TPA: (d)CMP kinase [Chloroflexota bacterium]|nr:(d)CMP kinase [Chloroflexota bacterium]
MPPRIIAIDGPAGSGKSVIGLWLARKLGYAFLDTGVLYRAITWLALRRGIPTSDGAALAAAAADVSINVLPHPERGCAVEIDGCDVTEELFAPAVNAEVSTVAAHPGVRRQLLPVQRRIAGRGRVVVVGRDIGTVVLPEAELKLYLEASAAERARRRWEQERRKGGTRSLDEVLAEVRRRDRLDSERATAPLRPAPDATILDTDRLSLDEEKQRILEIVRDHR